MAQLIEIQKVTIDPVELAAKVRVADDAPLMTSEDYEATERVLGLVPGLVDHVCLGDDGATFGEVVSNTELPHLLEHLTVELLAKTERAGDISCGRTEASEDDDRTFTIRLDCPDDVLTVAALSSAEWIVEWAFNGGGEPAPDIDAIASGLVGLIDSLDESEEPEEEAAEESEVEAEAEEPAEDAAEEADEVDVEYPAEEPAEQFAEEYPAEEAAEEYVEEFPTEVLADEYADEYPAEEPVDEYADEYPEEAGEEAGTDEDEDDDDWNMANVPAPRPIR